MRKRITNSRVDGFFAFAFNVQPILLKIGLLLLGFLILVQALHYYHFFENALRPSYSLKGPLNVENGTYADHGTISFTTNIKHNDLIIIKVNGLLVKRIESNKPTSVYINSLDVLEIDATKARGAYEIIIDAEPSSFLPQNYTKRLKVHGKLYRLPPLY